MLPIADFPPFRGSQFEIFQLDAGRFRLENLVASRTVKKAVDSFIRALIASRKNQSPIGPKDSISGWMPLPWMGDPEGWSAVVNQVGRRENSDRMESFFGHIGVFVCLQRVIEIGLFALKGNRLCSLRSGVVSSMKAATNRSLNPLKGLIVPLDDIAGTDPLLV